MSDDYLNQPISLGAASSGSPVAARSTASSSSAFSSPYLNYDPRFLQQSQPEFIFPEGAAKQRGRFELAFSQIGSSAMIGAAIGGTAGLYNGVRLTTLAKETGKLRRTQLLNHVMKQGSATANTFGTLAVMYSGFGVILQWVRGEEDDVNTLVAGTATGLLYKSTAGLKRCAVGGGVGLGIASAYALFTALSDGRGKFGLNKTYL